MHTTIAIWEQSNRVLRVDLALRRIDHIGSHLSFLPVLGMHRMLQRWLNLTLWAFFSPFLLIPISGIIVEPGSGNQASAQHVVTHVLSSLNNGIGPVA